LLTGLPTKSKMSDYNKLLEEIGLEVPSDTRKYQKEAAPRTWGEGATREQKKLETEKAELTARDRWLKMNQKDGVPLVDDEKYVKFWQRAAGAFQSDEERGAWLAKQPGVLEVRNAMPGNSLVFRRIGDDGEPVDVVWDKEGWTINDLADAAPEMLTAVIQARAAGGKVGVGSPGRVVDGKVVPKALPQQVLEQAGIGYGIATAGEAASSAMVGKRPQIVPASASAGDIAKTAGKQALELGKQAMWESLGVVPDVLKKASAPFAGYATRFENENLPDAIEYFRKTHGIKYTPSIAAATSNPSAAGIMSFIRQQERAPLGPGKALYEEEAVRQDAMRRMIDSVMLFPPGSAPSGAEVVQRTGSILNDGRAALEAAIASGRVATRDDAEAFLRGSFALPARPDDFSAGKSIRKKVVGLHEEKQAALGKEYAALSALTQNRPILSTKPILDFAEETGKDPWLDVLQPELSRIKKLGGALTDRDEEAVDLFDSMGRVMPTKKGEPILLTIDQARRLRTFIGDRVNDPQAFPGVSDKERKGLFAAASRVIEEGLDNAPDDIKPVKDMLLDLNKRYKAFADQFESQEIAPVFKGTRDGQGGLHDNEVVQRVWGSSDAGTSLNPNALRQYRDILGAGSPEYGGLLAAGYRRIMDGARSSAITGRIDGERFYAMVSGLPDEVTKEMFGAKSSALRDAAATLKALKATSLDPQEISEVLAGSPSLWKDRLENLVKIEAQKDELYKANFVDHIIKGYKDPSSIDPDEFVYRYLFKNPDERQLSKVLNKIESVDPKLRSAISMRVFADIVERSRAPFSASNAASRIAGGDDIKIIATSLADDVVNNKSKLKLVLGEDAYRGLEALSTVLTAEAKGSEIAKAGGSLAGQTEMIKQTRALLNAPVDIARGKSTIVNSAMNSVSLRVAAVLATTFPDAFRRTDIKPTPAKIRALLFATPEGTSAMWDAFGGNEEALAAIDEKLKRGSSGDEIDAMIEGFANENKQ
jgi:hypothetical protein